MNDSPENKHVLSAALMVGLLVFVVLGFGVILIAGEIGSPNAAALVVGQVMGLTAISLGLVGFVGIAFYANKATLTNVMPFALLVIAGAVPMSGSFGAPLALAAIVCTWMWIERRSVPTSPPDFDEESKR